MYGALLVCVLFAVGCSRNASIPHGASPLAMTGWYCSEAAPHTFYRSDVRDDRTRYGEARAHEEMHVEQALRYGCHGWNRMQMFEQFREDMESEAFCAMVRYAVKMQRMTFPVALQHYALWMSGTPGGGDYRGAVQRIMRYC